MTGALLRVVSLAAVFALAACASDHGAAASPSTEQSTVKNYTGILRSGFAAIGGESTGWMFESADLEHPIEADITKVGATARQWEGKPVRVWGRTVIKKYVERGDVSIFVVERIDPVM